MKPRPFLNPFITITPLTNFPVSLSPLSQCSYVERDTRSVNCMLLRIVCDWPRVLITSNFNSLEHLLSVLFVCSDERRGRAAWPVYTLLWFLRDTSLDALTDKKLVCVACLVRPTRARVWKYSAYKTQDAMMIEAVHTSETSVYFNKTTWRYMSASKSEQDSANFLHDTWPHTAVLSHRVLLGVHSYSKGFLPATSRRSLLH
jgi:hypothetical protein